VHVRHDNIAEADPVPTAAYIEQVRSPFLCFTPTVLCDGTLVSIPFSIHWYSLTEKISIH